MSTSHRAIIMSTSHRAINERSYVNLKYFIKFIKEKANMFNKLQREVFGNFMYCSMDYGVFILSYTSGSLTDI
jgi:hypothetical protein